MEKEKIEEYSNHYKRVQKKLSIGVMIFIIVFGIALVAIGTLIIVVNQTKTIIIVGSIMILLGIFDGILGIRFNKVTQKRIEKMSQKEAAERYSKITGNR